MKFSVSVTFFCDGTGRDGWTDGQTDIGTDRLFSENNILDIFLNRKVCVLILGSVCLSKTRYITCISAKAGSLLAWVQLHLQILRKAGFATVFEERPFCKHNLQLQIHCVVKFEEF